MNVFLFYFKLYFSFLKVKRGVVSFLKSNTLREKSPSRSSGKFQVEAVVYIPNSDRDSLEDAGKVLFHLRDIRIEMLYTF